MTHLNTFDFNECCSEEVMFLLTLSLYSSLKILNITVTGIVKTPHKSNFKHAELREVIL